LRTVVVTLLVGVLFLSAIAITQYRIQSLPAGTDEELLLYLPNEKLLNHFTAGLSPVIADLLWLRSIQYTGKHFRSDLKFTWLNHMCTTVVRLDPYFVDAYRLGGMFLASLQGDDDASLRLLRHGVPYNPYSWELPYEMAMVYMLNRRDQPGSTAMAGRYLSMAVQTEQAPPWVVELAANVQAAHDLGEVEQEMWAKLLQSDDAFMRDMAHQKLAEFHLHKQLDILEEAAEMYTERTGRAPQDIEALVTAGILTQMPEDPLGGRFYIDDQGRPQSSTLVEVKTKQLAARIQQLIKLFRDQNGRWPQSLDELVEKGIMSTVYPHPQAGHTWHYDATTGQVE
jgi:hypothetical protein